MSLSLPIGCKDHDTFFRGVDFAKCYKKSLSLTIQLDRLKARGKSLFASQQFTLVLCGVHGGISKKCQSRHDVEIDCIRRKSLAGRPKKYFTEEEKKQALKARQEKYYKNNKELCLQRSIDWAKNNSDRKKELWKKYYHTDKVKRPDNYVKERYDKYIKNNPKYINLRKKYNQTEQAKESRNKYKQNNKLKELERRKNYYSKNKCVISVKAKIYRDNNFHLIKAKNIRRREREKTQNSRFTKSELRKVYSNFGSQCYICKSNTKLCIDHHYPLSLGNSLTVNNAVLLCNSCNCKKGTKLPEFFYSPEQLTDLQLNYGISKSPLREEQPSLFEARMPKNLERDNGILEAMNAA